MPSTNAIYNPILRDDSQFVKPIPTHHPNRLTIQHWQLRDLLVCPSSSDEFLYVNNNYVNLYNTESGQITPMMKDLTFTPTCLAEGFGYLATGGQRSEVMVRQMNSNWCAHRQVGGSINNSICIANHGGDIRMLVCNNDETIKSYSLPEFQRIATISLPTAVNYASVSPDGRKMVAVGDSNQVFLFDITSNGDYQGIGTYTATSDAGFSCAWSQSSDKFAVASQDGYISVWDIRNSDKICKIPTKQNPQVKGAARSVKFSRSGSVDLLMFSEHVSYVHIIDARTFNERQTLRVSPPDHDQHISGITFTPDSKGIFVGLEDTVLEYQVDTMIRRGFPAGSLI